MHYLSHLAAMGAGDIHPGGALASRLLLHSLQLQPGQTVLEVGCGTARTLTRIATDPTLHVVGVDLMPEMLREAARRAARLSTFSQLDLAQASAQRLPFRDGCFDAVYAESVLGIQTAGDIAAALREMRRVLRPGGRCVINEAVWRSSASDEQVANANLLCIAAFGLRQASHEPWRARQWHVALQAAGFRVIGSGLLKEQLARQPLPRTHRWLARLESALERTRLSLVGALHAHRRQQRRYALALHVHRQLGQLIEPHLFILHRP